LRALCWLEKQVQSAKDEAAFAERVNKIIQEAKKVRIKPRYVEVTAAWDEFRETLIEDRKADDLPPDGSSFITRVCGSGFHILWFRIGQARRARSP